VCHEWFHKISERLLILEVTVEEIKVRNKKLDEAEFLKERAEVLSMWHTGKEVDIDESVEYHKSLPDHKVFWKVVDKLHREGKSAVFPRAGTPILEQEIELNKWLIDSGMVFVPVTPDSYCRLLQFEKAQLGLDESNRTGEPKLNGYPTVIHGVKGSRKVVDACGGALCQRLTNLDCRLMGEIAFASGMTAALEDPLINFGCYEKKSTVEQNIRMCQYVYRLCGYYADRGVTLNIDIDGMMPDGTFPMSVDIAGVVAVALLCAEQGVKSVTPWSGMLGHMAQDIAWTRLTRKLVREYLDKFGFQDVKMPGVSTWQIPLYPYPENEPWATAFLCYSAVVGALSGAEGVYLRTVDEALGIPTKEAHYKGYSAAHWIFNIIREQKVDMVDWKDVAFEEDMAEREIRAILDKVLELGDGDVAVGLVKAFDMGIMDNTFSSSIHMKGKALGIRDSQGACRYLDFGNLPIPEDIKKIHQEKVAEREKRDGKKMDYQDVISEFWAFSKAHIVPPVAA
jgi:methylaspartate mutase epsilon subunit